MGITYQDGVFKPSLDTNVHLYFYHPAFRGVKSIPDARTWQNSAHQKQERYELNGNASLSEYAPPCDHLSALVVATRGPLFLPNAVDCPKALD
jgi:hypothetical protein